MTALPTDILGEIIHYVNDIGTVNAIARTCATWARIVRDLADFIADRLANYRQGNHSVLSNGVKHGIVVMPLGYICDTFTVTYRRGALVSWLLHAGKGTIVRGHRDTHYVVVTSSDGVKCDYDIGVYDNEGAYHRYPIYKHHRDRRQRLKGHIIDDVIVPSVIEQWSAMNVTKPTRPFVVYCGTRAHAKALNELGIVDARAT